MEAPPLLLSRAPNLQIVLAIVVPALYGLIVGVLLGVSEIAYVITSLLGILGGLAAGYEHRGAGEGALRGVAGGTLFGSFILFGAALTGSEAKAHLIEPVGVLVVITTVFGIGLGALGGRLRARHEQRHAAAAAAGT